jgi:peptidoglycan hydrolase CwlO-like protein
MKKSIRLLVLVVCILILMLFGCKPESSEQTPQTQLEYQREVENTLNELDRSIAALQAKADTVAEESKAEFNAMLSDVQEKRAQARAQLEKLKKAGANAWQDMRAEVDETVEDLQDTYDRTISRFQ